MKNKLTNRSGTVLVLAMASTTLSFPISIGLIDLWCWTMFDLQFSSISWDLGKAIGTGVMAMLSLLTLSLAMDISKETAKNLDDPQKDEKKYETD